MKNFLRKNLIEICTHKSGMLNEGLLDWLVNLMMKNKFDMKTGKYIGSNPKIKSAAEDYDQSKKDAIDALNRLKSSVRELKKSHPEIDIPDHIIDTIKELEKKQSEFR